MRINSVPDVKCFCNNKNMLRAQSMVWHFVRHPVCIILSVQREGNLSFAHTDYFFIYYLLANRKSTIYKLM